MTIDGMKSLLPKLTFLILFIASSALSAQDSDRAKLDFFETKIRPVLIEHCYECHSAKSPELQGGLLVDSRDAIRVGGDSGEGVVPGDPDASSIIEAIRYESYEMPPSGKLPDSVIADFENWIADGAVDPRESASNSSAKVKIDVEQGKSFWSFQPVKPHAPPKTRNRNWSRNSIDDFILAMLESKSLPPGQDATRTELVRRIYFDLIGLPPTPDEVDEFLHDRSEDRLEQLVDRLLDRNEFGERWARHWLDVARYSDSSGGGRVLIFHEAWRYRDYVIDAFNDDKPYDQFVREQIAGDLLPFENHKDRGQKVTATGFLALGPHNYELQDKELLRMEIVDEQIDVIGRSMMGMTLGCVRCHDHKFDPIPIEDYYALAGIFRSTHSVVNANVSRFVETALPLDSEQQKIFETEQSRIQELENQLKSLRKEVALHQADMNSLSDSALDGLIVDDVDAKTQGRWSDGTLKPFVGSGYRYSGGAKASARFEFTIPNEGNYDVRISYTASGNRSNNVPVVIESRDEKQTFEVNQRVKPVIQGRFQSLGKFDFEANEKVDVVLGTSESGYPIIDAVQLTSDALKKDEPVDEAAVEALQARRTSIEGLIKTANASIASIEQDLQALKKSAIAAPPKVMSVREHSAKEVGDYFVCIRGDAHKLGDSVERRSLSVLPDSAFEIADAASGRLEFANWLTDSKNPLTARVYVNRVWKHLFGEGLVRTTDNFGSMGELPSHPELLDYLANELVKNRWSTKDLIRQIVLSRAYGLSSASNELAERLDPENRLLSRANQRRLDVEAIRDAMLCFSGELDRESRGPSVKPGLKREFGYVYKSRRRTIYLPVFRNTLHDMLDVFDFPNPNIVSGRRAESTLPAQALYMMNSPFVLEQAKGAADRVISSSVASKDRIEFAYRSALGRKPSEAERASIEKFLQQFDSSDEAQMKEAWTEVCHTLISCLDFRFIK